MSRHLIRAALFAATLFLTLSTQLPAAEPLPKGAKARLGTARMRDQGGWVGAALTPDGKHLVASSSSGFKRYDVTTGEPAGELGKPIPGFGGGRLELSADGSRATVSGFNAIVVWETGSGKALAKVERPLPYGSTPSSLSADGKFVAVGGVKNEKAKDAKVTAIVWDVDKNQKAADVAVVQNQLAFTAISPDGKTFATWGTHYEPNPPKDGIDPATDPSRIIQFWEVATGKELSKARPEGHPIAGVTFSPDGQTAAVAQGAGTIRLFDPKTGAETRRLFGRSDQGTRVVFSGDGKTLATAGYDGTVQLWSVAEGKRLGQAESPVGPTGGVRGIVFTAPDRAVVWATIGAAAFVWEVPSGKLLSPGGGHTTAVTSVAFRPDGKEILTGGGDGTILRWDAASGKELGEVELRSPGATTRGPRLGGGPTVISPDAKTAVVDRNGRAVYDLTSGAQVAAPTAGAGFDVRPYLCADARTLLLVPSSYAPPGKPQPKSLRVVAWDTATGTRLAEFETPVGDLVAAAVTPDRTKLVTALTTRPPDGEQARSLLTAWDLTVGGKKLGELTEAASFASIFIVPVADNKTALVSTPRGKLIVVDLATGKAARELQAPGLIPVCPPVLSPDGKSVAVAASGGSGPHVATIRVLDWDSGKPTRLYQGHTNGVTSLAFSADGKTLASGSYDTTVLLWDLTATGEQGEDTQAPAAPHRRDRGHCDTELSLAHGPPATGRYASSSAWYRNQALSAGLQYRLQS